MGDPALDIFDNPASNDITEDETWTGNKLVYNTVHVRDGATLTIAAGANVTLLGDLVINSGSRLVVSGTYVNPVDIHGDVNASNIELRLSNSDVVPRNSISYCKFWDLYTGVSSNSSSVDIDNCYFYDCEFGYLGNSNSEADIEDSYFFNCDVGVVILRSGVNLRYNEIHDNNRFGIFCYDGGGEWMLNTIEDHYHGQEGRGARIISTSAPLLIRNNIWNNTQCGLDVHSSTPIIWGGNTISQNNNQGAIYCSYSTLSLDYAHNNLMSLNDQGYIIYDASEWTHYVRGNYFGNPNLVNASRFYPNGYTYIPFDLTPNEFGGGRSSIPEDIDKSIKNPNYVIASDDSIAGLLFLSGWEHFRDSEFDDACDCFELVLRNYSDSYHAVSALNYLYWSRQLGNMDLRTIPRLISDYVVEDSPIILQRMADRVYVKYLIDTEQYIYALEVCGGQLERARARLDSLETLLDIAVILNCMGVGNIPASFEVPKSYAHLSTTSNADLVNVLCDLLDYDPSIWNENKHAEFPDEYFLSQVYPNPFNSTTTISYALPAASPVSLKVYDLSGREVRTLMEGNQQAGYHRTILNASDMPSGLYFVRMEAAEFSAARKVMLVR